MGEKGEGSGGRVGGKWGQRVMEVGTGYPPCPPPQEAEFETVGRCRVCWNLKEYAVLVFLLAGIKYLIPKKLGGDI